MKPQLSVVTLGVKNLERSLRFYMDTLGWPIKPTDSDEIVFFQLNGMLLSLYDRKKLAENATVNSISNGFAGFTLAQNTDSVEEVDRIFETLEANGVKIVMRPAKAEWGGYGGHFCDPDGYLWEDVYNPFWRVNEEGKVLP